MDEEEKKIKRILKAIVDELGVSVFDDMSRFANILLDYAPNLNKQRNLIVDVLEKTGIKDKFDAISCGLDTQKSKPDPEVFLIAAQKLGISPENCLVIEDSNAGIEAAKRGNMYALAVGAAEKNEKADFHAPSLDKLNYNDIFEA